MAKTNDTTKKKATKKRSAKKSVVKDIEQGKTTIDEMKETNVKDIINTKMSKKDEGNLTSLFGVIKDMSFDDLVMCFGEPCNLNVDQDKQEYICRWDITYTLTKDELDKWNQRLKEKDPAAEEIVNPKQTVRFFNQNVFVEFSKNAHWGVVHTNDSDPDICEDFLNEAMFIFKSNNREDFETVTVLEFD